ncbi:MAG: hypothetical protein HY078_05495 [Elusimicrobia bacterium]|nr:hypothetical protein [Elusimicrobiota bacterium]
MKSPLRLDRSTLSYFVLCLAMTRMAGELLRLPLLVEIGLASAIAPAPKVLSTVPEGKELFPMSKTLEWADETGEHSTSLAFLARLRGPFGRRWVYHNALGRGPAITASDRDQALRYALCGAAPVLTEADLPHGRVTGARVLYAAPKGRSPAGVESIEVRCQ